MFWNIKNDLSKIQFHFIGSDENLTQIYNGSKPEIGTHPLLVYPQIQGL
jgi:hypothetical protein